MDDHLKKAFDDIHASEKLKNQTKLYIRQKTHVYPKKQTLPFKRMALAAVCFVFLFLGGYRIYFVPTASISIDINPSVELEINRFNKVISVKGFNEDGRQLADMLDLRFSDYTDAVSAIINHTAISALLEENELLTFTVVCENDKQNSDMMSQIKKYTEGKNNIFCYCANPNEVAEAHACGLSYGKYNAYLKLQAIDPTISPEEVQNMTMCQIRDLIESKTDNTTTDSDTQGSQHHHGNGHDHH